MMLCPPFLFLLAGQNLLANAPVKKHQLLINGERSPDLRILNAFFDAREERRIRLRGRGLVGHLLFLSYQMAGVQFGGSGGFPLARFRAKPRVDDLLDVPGNRHRLLLTFVGDVTAAVVVRNAPLVELKEDDAP
jgi:hypothetical protein